MECRCYQGGEGRTKMKLLRYHREDFVSFGIGILLILAVVALGRFGL
jgi:energy-coupling factor transport system permease protein